MRLRSLLPAAIMVFGATALAAQEPARQIEKKLGPGDIIMPHLVDSKQLEVPCIKSLQAWACEVDLPVWPVTIGGKTYDFGPTKHVVFMLLAAVLAAIMLIATARAHRRHTSEVGRPRGFAAGLEAAILYLRNEIYIPVLGGRAGGGAKFVPFVMSLFFFILFCNVLGLIPYGSTPTGNISVTATLALITFIVIEVTGMVTLGRGYVNTIVFWPHDLPLGMRIPLAIVMSPLELVGKFTKPFALTIRLFANMIAGHVIILALIGLIFMFGWLVAPAPLLMALFIMIIEVLVAFIQAFIFSLLAAVFIGLIRTAHP